MKIYNSVKFILFTFLYVIIVPYTVNAQQEAQQYIVDAKNGLNVRENPYLSANKIAKLPYGSIIKLIEDTGKTFKVTNNASLLIGNWLKVKYNNYAYLVNNETEQFEKEGYVFEGYLKKFNNTDAIIDVKKITKSEYVDLKIDPVEYNKSLKAIGTLDSIKNALKGRVSWNYEADEYGDKRNDAIKSITTNNGQKLIINQNNDIGFSEGFSAYYPDYSILVFEGGHASDATFSIKTGKTTRLTGNPIHIISSPKGTYRLNGYETGQECISYFFQLKGSDGEYTFLTDFNFDYDNCTLNNFYWLDEREFIYSKMDYNNDEVNGEKVYYTGEFDLSKENHLTEEEECYILTESDFLKISFLKDESLKYTFNDSKIYGCPDKSSKIVSTLKFNEKIVTGGVYIQKYANDTIYHTNLKTNEKTISEVYKKEISDWYSLYNEVEADSAFVGYIQAKDVALQVFPKSEILVGKNNSRIELKGYGGNKLLDTISLELMHGFEIDTLTLNKQKKTNKIIKYTTYRESCPGTQLIQFIAYENGKFTKLVRGLSTGELGMYEEETIYLPVTDINGKTTLEYNGDPNAYIPNEDKAEYEKIKTIELPKDVPINQLIVKTIEVADAVYDEDSNYIELEDGTVKIKVRNQLKFYKWDGVTVTEVK